jgi:Flp pilus assembly protein TadD
LEYGKLGKLREAEEDYTKAITLDPNYIDARLNRGIIYYNSNRFNEAEQDYNLAIQLDPTNSKAFNNRGRLYHDCRKIQQA